MIKLLQKVSLFFLLLVLLKMPFAYVYENEIDFRKRQFAAEEYNAVFIGSSRTKYAVIPAYFDSLTDNQTKSFNLGVEGGLPPRTFDWCEELIKTKPNLQYVFVELGGEPDKFGVSEEIWKSFSFREYWRIAKKLPFDQSAKYHDQIAVSFFKPNLPVTYSDYNVPLTDEKIKQDILVKRAFASEEVLQSHLWNLEVEKGLTPESVLNENYWKKVRNLIDLAEARRIHLYFFIPPRLAAESEVSTIQPIYQRLESKYKLNALHYHESLYLDDTSIDTLHLNNRGARQFTEHLANALTTGQKKER